MLKEKFEFFAKKYMDTIYRVAYSWTKNSEDANDVTQDVLIQLFRSEKEFESEAHLKNWLMKVTVNQCKMLFRSPWRRMEDIDEYANTLRYDDENCLDLFQAVMKMKKEYRVPILLFYYEGCSILEIATILGIPEKTVSTRLFRARAQLKEYLKED